MIIPPEQQQSMKRFLTPGRAPLGGGSDGPVAFNTISNNIQSIQRLRHDESKGMIAHSNKQSRMKLPKIRSLTLNTSYKFLNKNHSEQKNPPGSGPFQNSPSTNLSAAMPNTYADRMEQLKNNGGIHNSTIQEATAENFHTNYGKFPHRGSVGGGPSGSSGPLRPEVENYVIDD